MRDDKRLESIAALLGDAAHAANPLRPALEELYAEFRDVLHQIDRITHISDRYQSAAREDSLSLTGRYKKQLRQLEKIARISDRYQSMMRELNEGLKEASSTDALTGIGNRRSLMERLKIESGRAERLSRPLTVTLADVDRFKSVNDAFGHDMGDKVLVEIAQAIRSCVREYDLCGRWGGEEFMVIMPDIGSVEGVRVVERMRDAIAGLTVRSGDSVLHLSASFGVAERQRGEDIFETVKRADVALFEAKRSGRNRFQSAY